MTRRGDADDGSDDLEEPEEEFSRPPRSRRRPPASHPKQTVPVRRWRTPEDESDTDEDFESPPARRGLFHRQSRPVYWRARDSLYFEPLVAVAIIVVMLVSLYAYTQNWPPVYVVESKSMQHGDSDILGLINTGDLVLAQRVPGDQITPYVVGLQTQYSTYGEYGDVLLYSADGQGATPIIHRAILFLQWNPSSASYNATDLAGLPCGNATHAVYSTPGTRNDCALTDLTGTLNLFGIGWHSVNVSVDLRSPTLGQHSGYLTMGDNNLACSSNSDCTGLPDQGPASISELVEPGWIIGVARGMLPWFGSVKLLLEGNAGMVPPQSWQFLGLTVAGLILLAFGIHYAFRTEGIEDQRRKDEEAEEAQSRGASSDGDAPEGSRGRRFLQAIRPWGRMKEDDGEIEEAVHAGRRASAPAARSTSRRRGRPSPKVRRSTKSKRKGRGPSDDDP
jgi:signal peptidase I